MSRNNPEGLAASLIRRSSGPLGDFRLPICSRIIENENLGYRLTPVEISRILERYKRHVNYWGTAFSTVAAELGRFAAVVGQSPSSIMEQFLDL